ncbi:MAG: dinitrogenase iron-molybdenum cofactor biosynthesis protein, partial [Gammaproteobacteria bacterium]|nr:dinitrogenase iron-molybdenum cofactor biosynthesis protein [Gammaproteobacteria bacterium]
AVGLPPTAESLATLSVKSLKEAHDGEFSEIEGPSLRSALACLQGEKGLTNETLPEIEPYRDGEMKNSIRVACASNSGALLDGHFGSCKRFLIYQVAADSCRLVAIRETDTPTATDQFRAAEDKNSHRASLIADCQILFVVSIGGPAAAKVVRAGVHPIKKTESVPAIEEINRLQQTIANDPPPWLAKVMGQTPQQRIRFATGKEDESEEDES